MQKPYEEEGVIERRPFLNLQHERAGQDFLRNFEQAQDLAGNAEIMLTWMLLPLLAMRRMRERAEHLVFHDELD